MHRTMRGVFYAKFQGIKYMSFNIMYTLYHDFNVYMYQEAILNASDVWHVYDIRIGSASKYKNVRKRCFEVYNGNISTVWDI